MVHEIVAGGVGRQIVCTTKKKYMLHCARNIHPLDPAQDRKDCFHDVARDSCVQQCRSGEIFIIIGGKPLHILCNRILTFTFFVNFVHLLPACPIDEIR